MWTRAVNLKVCLKADVYHFLQAVQAHVFDYGLMNYCLSDLGSSIKAGSNVISTFLQDAETHKYFEENNITCTEFEQYPKGNSTLGGLVECCVKMVKLHTTKVMRRNVLLLESFRFLVLEMQHCINRRPISFKNSLRDSLNAEMIEPVTPEQLIKGYSVDSIIISPAIHIEPEMWTPDRSNVNSFKTDLQHLKESRECLAKVYNEEFLQSLMHQATNSPKRYAPAAHRPLKRGDVVLLKDPFTKALNYPMGIITKVVKNSLDETTAAYVFKGATREKVYRDSSSLILLVPNDDENDETQDDLPDSDPQAGNDGSMPVAMQRPRRKAAEARRRFLHDLIAEGSV